jgi:SAM-dependent methyltransferase
MKIGLSNLECRVLDAQDVGTLGVDLFDAAICRNGLMFPPDLHCVLSGIFRVLKPGAKLGVVVWSDASANPYQEIPREVLEGMGLQSGATRNQASRLGPPGALEAAFGRAGFVSVEKHCLPAPRHFASVAEAVARLEEMGGIADTLRQLSGTDRERVLAAIELELERFAGADGCDITGESLVVGAVVPLPV